MSDNVQCPAQEADWVWHEGTKYLVGGPFPTTANTGDPTEIVHSTTSCARVVGSVPLDKPAIMPAWSRETPTKEGHWFLGWYDDGEWMYMHLRTVPLQRGTPTARLYALIKEGVVPASDMADYIGFDVWWLPVFMPPPPGGTP